ncbi:hypothetical protein Tco_0158605 [Tanacetum coccineum]
MRYLRVIWDMYDVAKTRVRTTLGNIEFFCVEVESAKWLNNRLESWREALEDNGLRVSKEKMKYLRCDFGRYEVVNQKVDIRIGDRILQPKESFRYLGSVIHRSGRIDEDVAHRIRAGWVKWRVDSRVLCDRIIPSKLKGKFYRLVIRPAMLYGSQCWPITKAQANRMEVEELRMLRWTCVDKMRGGRLRWFGHVKRRPQTAPIRRVEALLIDGSKRNGGPKLRWEDRLKQDIKELLLSEDMTSDRNAWRDRVRISGLLLGCAAFQKLLSASLVAYASMVFACFDVSFVLVACLLSVIELVCLMAMFWLYVLFLRALLFFLCVSQ